MSVLGWASLLVGTMAYTCLFKKWEFRTVLVLSNIIGLLGGLIGAVFILDLHKSIGFSDKGFYAVQSFILESLCMAFLDLPLMVLFAKITPQRIEGTIFALLTGTINFSTSVLLPAIGSAINDAFFKITKDNITSTNMVNIAWLSTGVALLPLLVICLVPRRSEV